MPDAPLTTSTSTDVEPVAKLLRYSFLLFALPATVLFGFTSGSLDGIISIFYSPITKDIRVLAGAVAAVSAVLLVLTAYIVSVMLEDDNVEKLEKSD